MNILFLTWDGPQVTYLESLFLPVFERLTAHGYRFRVIQFTWADERRVEAVRRACEAHGVPYLAYPVLRRAGALGALWSALRSVPMVRRSMRAEGIQVLMPRSVFCGFVALLARVRGMRLVFDADGLPLDERVEFAGLNPRGPTYRALRRLEAETARAADVVLTRTAFARDVMRHRAGAAREDPRFFVVGNGRDEAAFQPQGRESDEAVRRDLGIGGAPLVAYVGSLGEQYCLSEMAETFKEIRRRLPDARLLILTGEVENGARLQTLCGGGGVAILKRVPPDAVPAHLSAADMGLSYRRPTFSMQAVAPVKLGEYLLCGVPALVSSGAGQAEDLADETAVRTLDAADALERARAADWFVDEVLPRREAYREAARSLGQRRFGLAATTAAYARALQGVDRKAAGSASADAR